MASFRRTTSIGVYPNATRGEVRTWGSSAPLWLARVIDCTPWLQNNYLDSVVLFWLQSDKKWLFRSSSINLPSKSCWMYIASIDFEGKLIIMNGSQWENGGHVFWLPFPQHLNRFGNTWRLIHFKALSSGKKYTEIQTPLCPSNTGTGYRRGLKSLKSLWDFKWGNR